MAKAAKKTEVTKPAKSAAVVAPKIDVNIATWIKTIARARGEVGEYVKTLRDDETIKSNASNKATTAKLEATEHGKTLLARYALFAKRGSQAGRRSRAKAA